MFAYSVGELVAMPPVGGAGQDVYYLIISKDKSNYYDVLRINDGRTLSYEKSSLESFGERVS